MEINFWDCPYSYGEEVELCPGDQEWVHHCEHPAGPRYCPLDNKRDGKKAACSLINEGDMKSRATGDSLGQEACAQYVCEIIVMRPPITAPLLNFPVELYLELKDTGVAFSSDREGVQQLAFTNLPGQEKLIGGGGPGAVVHVPLLKSEAETIIWMTYGEGVQGKYVEEQEFWKALDYACVPRVYGLGADGLHKKWSRDWRYRFWHYFFWPKYFCIRCWLRWKNR